jgi:hypothetical protein
LKQDRQKAQMANVPESESNTVDKRTAFSPATMQNREGLWTTVGGEKDHSFRL